MNCPYCDKRIDAATGFQEAWKFKQHLARCKKHPRHVVINDQGFQIKPFTLNEALAIRSKSNQ